MSIQELLNSEVGLNLLDKELVLAYALGVSREHLMAHGEEEVSDEDLAVIFSYFRRLQAGEPLAYIVEEKEFFGLPFFVDRRVLIPRPETEMIVEEALAFLETLDEEELEVLDVGTGSGCIAVALAANAGVRVVALDLSEDALAVAELNAQQNSVDDLVDFWESDLLEVVDFGSEFAVIAANLPYIGEVENRHVAAETENFEPHLALFGGDDGLDLYRRLFEELFEKGIGFGLLLGEFCYGQSEAMAAELERFFPGRWVIKKDLAGIERIFVVYGA